MDATVVSVAEVQGKRQLVAFCIFKGDHSPGISEPLAPLDTLDKVSELMGELTTISHYMMPALFLPFSSFPTLPSGKSNRKELVKMAEAMGKQDIASYIPMDGNAEEFVPVTTKEERIMQHAWAEVLDEPAEIIGAASSFLSLGGDSISAINVVAECRKLSYTISVANVLANATLAEQAKCLKPAQEKKVSKKEAAYEIPESVLLALKSAGVEDGQIERVLPAGPGQVEFLTQGHTEHQFWNLTACRDLPADFDLGLWIKTTESLTVRNEIMRTTYHQANSSDPGSWVQVSS